MRMLIRKLLGLNNHTQESYQQKVREGDSIKDEILSELSSVSGKLDRLNTDTSGRIKEIKADLASATYKIAVSTGARNRGLR